MDGWLGGLAGQVLYGACMHVLNAAAAPASTIHATCCSLLLLPTLWRCSQEECEVLEQRIVMPDPSSATLVRKLVAQPEAAAAAAGAAGRRGKAAAPRECCCRCCWRGWQRLHMRSAAALATIAASS